MFPEWIQFSEVKLDDVDLSILPGFKKHMHKNVWILKLLCNKKSSNLRHSRIKKFRAFNIDLVNKELYCMQQQMSKIKTKNTY